MIQRIQTLWLSLAVLLSAAAFFFPLAVFRFSFKDMQIDHIYSMVSSSKELIQTSPAWAALICCLITALIALITIFLYKNRSLQMKVLAFAFLVSVIELALLYFYQLDAGLKETVSIVCKGTPEVIDSAVQSAKTTWGFASFFPIVQIFLYILALKAIKKDEALVRSADRLR